MKLDELFPLFHQLTEGEQRTFVAKYRWRRAGDLTVIPKEYKAKAKSKPRKKKVPLTDKQKQALAELKKLGITIDPREVG